MRTLPLTDPPPLTLPRTEPLEGHLAHKKPRPLRTIQCLWPYVSPRGAAVTYARGTHVRSGVLSPAGLLKQQGPVSAFPSCSTSHDSGPIHTWPYQHRIFCIPESSFQEKKSIACEQTFCAPTPAGDWGPSGAGHRIFRGCLDAPGPPSSLRIHTSPPRNRFTLLRRTGA